MKTPDLIAAGEAARIIGVTPSRFHQLRAKYDLGRQIAGHWFFERAEIERFARREKPKGGRPKTKGKAP